MRIGELARKTGCDVETIRFYEKSGLLDEPVRSAAGYREYQTIHLERLQFIRHCRSLKIGLRDVRALLDLQTSPSAGCERVNALLDKHIAAIQSQMATLRLLEAELIALRHQCNAPHSVQDCRILQNLVDGGGSGRVRPATCAPMNRDMSGAAVNGGGEGVAKVKSSRCGVSQFALFALCPNAEEKYSRTGMNGASSTKCYLESGRLGGWVAGVAPVPGRHMSPKVIKATVAQWTLNDPG